MRFNSSAQALASRIVRQWDKAFDPGPEWCIRIRAACGIRDDGGFSRRQPVGGPLRGGDGIFGIGTADAVGPAGKATELHRQILDDLCFSFGTALLVRGTIAIESCPWKWSLGPTLAKPLHSVWEIIEKLAEPLDRLCRQMGAGDV